MRGADAVRKLLGDFCFESVLDVGGGPGEQAAAFARGGKRVTMFDASESVGAAAPPGVLRYVGDWGDPEHLRILPDRYDVVFASHVLEHLPDVGSALGAMRRRAAEATCLVVPNRRDRLAGGHLSYWTAGLLAYRCILAGWDCRDASVLNVPAEISIILRRDREVPESVLGDLRYDSGDVDALARYFPRSWDVYEGAPSHSLPSQNW